MIHPDEDDLEEYRRQDREERAQALREQQRDREPPIGDPCSECDGSGQVQVKTEDDDYDSEGCPRCQGTGVW